ncbi:MAG: hypothetical protein IPH07_23780 [Deltaproteobacteria bacterium]|nr:hypothetical protein [Deltaproteobacteria bacterium]
MTITTVTFRVYGADWYAVEGDLPDEVWLCGTPELALLVRLPGFREARAKARLDESTLPTVGDRMRNGFPVQVERGYRMWVADNVLIWADPWGPYEATFAIQQTYYALDRALGQTATATATATATCPDCRGSRVYVGLGFTPAEACRRCNGTGVV